MTGGTRHTVIALDVGGTSIKGAIVDAELSFRRRATWTTPRAKGPRAVVTAVLGAILELKDQAHDATSVGLVVPGLVDELSGIAVSSENIGWRNVPFRSLVAEATRLPVGFGHDVRAGGLAERTYGAARGADNVLFMPIGTGVSGAMIIGGRLVSDPYAGEIGHIDVGTGYRCACGSTGCLETIASGPSIARLYKQAVPGAQVDARSVGARAAAGEPVAAHVWARVVGALATALATYVSLLAPEKIIIAGGVSAAGDVLLGPLRQQLTMKLTWQRIPLIVTSELKLDAGCVGAAVLARRAADAQRTTPRVGDH